jgi:hypothetical protein
LSRSSGAVEWSSEPFEDAMGFVRDQAVVVRASDYGREAVSGSLVHATRDELVLSREDPRAGRVYVHFPRLGFELSKASA